MEIPGSPPPPLPRFFVAFVPVPVGNSQPEQQQRAQNPGLGHPCAHACDAAAAGPNQQYHAQAQGQYHGYTGQSGSDLRPQPWHLPLQQTPNYQLQQPLIQLQQQHGPIPTPVQGVYPRHTDYYVAGTSYSPATQNLQDPSTAAMNHIQRLPALHTSTHQTLTLPPGQQQISQFNSSASLYSHHQLPVHPYVNMHVGGMVPTAVSGVNTSSIGIGGSNNQVSHHLVHNPAAALLNHSHSQCAPMPTRSTANRKRPRKREPRDPRKPKKHASPFIHFCVASGHRIKKGSVKKARGEHMKALAEMWHKMSEEGKKPYVDAYEVDQMRYLREMKEYNDLKFGKK
mmetsp:Transcript_1552/g.2649  ORF Transcript_1552/g.2649 Transcript_1552/m.2649 type:complete len:341 (+) Transcript_1552:101-1123(+)